MKFSKKLIELLQKAKSIGVLTGAGISAESGVPTFRGKDGWWKKHPPEELATYNAFMKNPGLVWEWYNYRKKLILGIEPNAGHFAIADMEKLYPTFYLITQNVDGLHKKAGSSNPIELHGNIIRSRCLHCNIIIEEHISFNDTDLPKCKCGSLLRPDVVWFGESLPEDALRKSEEASRNCEIFFSIGTSAVVHPAASIPLWAKYNGAYLIEFNIEYTLLSQEVDETIIGKSSEILPELMKIIK